MTEEHEYPRPAPAMNQDKLNEILTAHRGWLHGETGGTRADLTRAELTRANLTRANLTRANLTRANLTRANLTRANLTRANLTRANLTRADLAGANLTGAKLTRANLTLANLTGANLTGAKLTHAVLTDANLTNATGDDCAAAMRTRAWLDAHHWVQGRWFDGLWDSKECSACLHGAALIAGGREFSNALTERGYSISWNDTPGRTEADIQAALATFCSA